MSQPFAASPDLAALVDRYDGRAPRYTSYPTALQFTPQVNETVYRGWLDELPTARPVSVYIHIPFCTRLCWYCGCNTRAVMRHAPIGEYVALLTREIELLAGALPGRLPVSRIHFGGGTPNTLNAQDLDGIFAALERAFDLGPGPSVAAELDPTSLTETWVQAAAAHGLDRASLGVQILDEEVQRAVNRREDFGQVARAATWLRAAGVASLNIDLMYGLPHQTVGKTRDTIEAVLTLRPERIALFGYAHVPWMKAHQRLIPEEALPGPGERLAQAEAAAARLVEAGYVRIGLDHFALAHDPLATAAAAGTLRRNFQGYTADPDETLLGLGASAIGTLPQGLVQNVSAEIGWRSAVADGRLPVARGVAMTGEDRLRGEIIERLMCDLRVDLAAVCARHGRPLSHLGPSLLQLAPFVEDGLVRMEGARLAVTGHGRLVVRSICAAFDGYFSPTATHHARAL